MEAAVKLLYILAWVTKTVLCLHYNSKCQVLQKTNRDSLALQPWH